MIGVFIIPTGLGCQIGGHAGDAVCAVNLIAFQCSDLVVNPNAVNASDINEMAPNCLYVEGSIIDRLLEGEIWLEKVKRNRILLAVNAPVSPHTINSVNAARVSLGIDIEIIQLMTPLVLEGWIERDGTAGGKISGVPELIHEVRKYSFDALAIQSPIDVARDVVEEYLKRGGVNPWGGIEAQASRMIARDLVKPVAHAPQQREGDYFASYSKVTDPRMAAEMVSVSYLHCVLKGLARAPRPIYRPTPEYRTRMIGVSDLDFLVTPESCYGEVHRHSIDNGVEVIVVRENYSVLNRPFPETCVFVENYLEAAGLIACRKIGIDERSVRVR